MTGQEVKEKRESIPIKQFVLAFHSGIHYQELCRFEDGANSLSIEQVGAIASSLVVIPGMSYRAVMALEREAREHFGFTKPKVEAGV